MYKKFIDLYRNESKVGLEVMNNDFNVEVLSWYRASLQDTFSWNYCVRWNIYKGNSRIIVQVLRTDPLVHLKFMRPTLFVRDECNL